MDPSGLAWWWDTTPVDDRPKYDLPVLCLDFDGVIHNKPEGWLGMSVAAGEPVPGALEFIKLALNFFTVFVHSARSATPEGRRTMHAWLVNEWVKRFGLTFDQAAQELKSIYWPVSKPHAHVSLDDRAIQFNGEWPDLLELRKFKPWNRA